MAGQPSDDDEFDAVTGEHGHDLGDYPLMARKDQIGPKG
jgi:hypothetical protein